MAARKLEREKVQEEKAAQAACNKAQREREAIRGQSVKQLQNEAKSAKPKPPNNGKKTAESRFTYRVRFWNGRER
jgi:hypothetical protein